MNPLILIITIVVYFIISFIIGLWKAKKIDVEKFTINRNSTGFLPLLFTLAGTIVGGGMFFAVGQIGYEAGVLGIIVGVAYFVGFIIMGFLVPTVRRISENKNYLTLMDVIEDKYKERIEKRVTIAQIFSFINFILFFFVLAAQFISLGLFLNYFLGLQFYSAIIIAATLIAVINVFIYSFFGGLRKDIATDFFQVIVIVMGCFLIAQRIFNSDMILAFRTLPSGYFTGANYGILFIVGALLFIPLTFLVRTDIWQRIITAKSDRTAQCAFFAAAPFTFVFYILFALVGMYAKSMNLAVAEPQFAVLELFSKLFTDYKYMLVIIAFFAAVLSTADTCLNNASVSFARFFRRREWWRYVNKDKALNERKLFRFLKWSTLGIGIFSLLAGYFFKNLVDLFVAVFSSLIIFTPAVLGALFSEKPNARAAFHSVLWGFIVFISLFIFVLSLRKIAFVPGIVVSIVIYFFIKKISPDDVLKTR